jgi:hypothetical protein
MTTGGALDIVLETRDLPRERVEAVHNIYKA